MKLSIWRWQEYRHVQEDESFETNASLLEKDDVLPTLRERQPRHLNIALATSMIFNMFLVAFGLIYVLDHHSSKDAFQKMYSPAQDVIEYRNQNFDYSTPDLESDYAGPPTPERDAKWRALHWVGDHRLTKSEASRIHNQTACAQPGSEDYMIVFTVFHDLHCLDSIRISLGYMRDSKWNSTYNPYTIPWPENFADGKYSPGHAHHCFNSIRQSLQCSSDVTPEVFQYDPKRNVVLTRMNVMHTCRNFEAIREWALERRYTGEYETRGPRDQQGLCGPDGCRTDLRI